MNNIYKDALKLLENGEDFVAATILSKLGSSPRTAGTKMIVRRDGSIIGTIGGGFLEAEVQRIAEEVMKSQAALIKSFNLTGADVKNMDMICGGQLEILVEFIDSTDLYNKKIFDEFIASGNAGKKSTIITQLMSRDAGQKIKRCLVKYDGAVVGREFVPKNIKEDITTKNIYDCPQVISLEGYTFLIEPTCASGIVYIFGAGHVGQKICAMANMVNFTTVVLDDRAEFANRERFNSADKIIVLDSFMEAFKNLHIHQDCYLVILTRGHAYDKVVLQQALRTNARYIGMIGSKRKRDTIYKALIKEGAAKTELEKVYSPIGLEIEAETPEEIAISIVAELIKVRAGSKND